MGDFQIRHHSEFDAAWKKATADGRISKEELQDLKKAAAKTADPKSVARENTDDYLVEQLEKGYGHNKVTFTHTGGKNVTAELSFVDGEIILEIVPKQVTDKNVDTFLRQYDRDGYASEADEKKVLEALKHVDKGSKAYKAITAWLDEKRPGATPESRKALTAKVLDPKLPEKERYSAYLQLAQYVDRDPKAFRDLSFKIYEGKVPASTDAKELAAGMIKDKKWGDRKLYLAMMESNNPSIRRSGIEGIASLETLEAVKILESFYAKTGSDDDKYHIFLALNGMGKGKGPVADEANAATSRIGKKNDQEFTADWKKQEAEKAASKSVADKTAAFGAKDAKAVKAYLATHGDEVLNYGSAADKGKLIGILLKDNSPEAKKWVMKLLTSVWTPKDMNKLVESMLKVTGSPPNLEAYLGKADYRDFNSHRIKIYGFDQQVFTNSSQIAKSRSFDQKVQAVTEHIEYAKVGIEDKGEAAARVKELLLSLGSRDEYEKAIKAMVKLGYSEKDLIGLLGENGRKEVFAGYEKGAASKAPDIAKGQAPKWNGGKVTDFAAKGSHAPNHRDDNMHHFLHQMEGKALEKGVHYAGHFLVKAGLKTVGHALEKLAMPVEIAHQFYSMAQGIADANGPGQWRTSAHWGYMDGYAKTFVDVAELWQKSSGLNDFMNKLPTIMRGIGTIDMDKPNSAYRSLGQYAGNRDAILFLVSLMDPAQGGSPEKLASFLDELARVKQGDNVNFRENMAAAVHRQFEKDH